MSRQWSTARFLVVIVAGLFAVVLFSGIAVADGPAAVDIDTLDRGDGGTYIITNASELQAMNQSLTADFELGGTINATNTSEWNGRKGFSPIGNESHSFEGTFDGNGYEIENLTVDRGTENYVGLFGNATDNTKIGNVSLTNATVTGNAHVGALVGESNGEVYDVDVSGEVITELLDDDDNSFIEPPNDGNGARTGGLVGMLESSAVVTNASASANVTGTKGRPLRIGGLVGFSRGEIRDSKATGDVEGENGVGGLVGRNVGHIENATATGNVTEVNGGDAFGGLAGYNGPFKGTADRGSISKSHASGNVTAANSDSVGGIVGSNQYIVNKSYATGVIEGIDNVGGLIGKNSGNAYVSESYATGNVSGNDRVGGFVGYNDRGEVSNSYANGTITEGNNHVGGLVGQNDADAIIEQSYVVVDFLGTGNGLVGTNFNSDSAPDGYWDTDATGVTFSMGGDGLSTFEMTSLVAKDYMDFNYSETWTATNRYPRLAWEGADEPDPYPAATPDEGEVWLLNDSDNGYYHNYSLDGGDIWWLGEVVASPGTADSAQIIEIAAGNATAEYDTLVVGNGTYGVETEEVNLTAGGGNLAHLFSYMGSERTNITRSQAAGNTFEPYTNATFRIDNPAASDLTIGDFGAFATDDNSDGGFYVESASSGASDSPLIGVYEGADEYDLTVTNTDFGMATNHGDTILLKDSRTAFDLELDLGSHSGAVINVSAASGLSVTNSTITEENDPRNNNLDGEGISFLKLESGLLDDVTIDNVTIAGATEANTVQGVVNITSLATDASVTMDDVEIDSTAQHAINVSAAFESLSLSGLNLSDIGKRGVTITDDISSVTITDSEIHETTGASLFVNANVSQYTVTNTTITNSSRRGIYLQGDLGNATIENNTLTDNTQTPIEFDVNAGQSTPYEVLDNHVDGSGNKNSLVVIRQHAQVNITDNTLLNSSLRGIYTDAADSVIENTRIENSSGSKGIHLASNAHDALIVDTTIIDSATLGIHVDEANNATIRNTTVEKVGGYGIRFNNSASDGELRGSSIANTTGDALDVGTNADVSVVDLSLPSGSISAGVTDTALSTSAAVPDGPKTYASGGESVNVTVGDSGELDNVSLSYDTNTFAIDQQALDFWRYNATGWHRENSTVKTANRFVATSALIDNSTLLTTFASNVSIAAANTAVDEGDAGTLDVTATNGSGSLLEAVVVNVTDNGGLGGLTIGETATTDSNGVASFGFRENSPGSYTINVSWRNDTAVNDTATVRVRRTGGGGGGGGGGGQPPAPPETTVTVDDANEDGTESEADGAESDDDDDAEESNSDAKSEASRPDTRVSVSNPEPGQTLVIEGDDAYITSGDPEPAADGSENSGNGGRDTSNTGGSADTDDSSTGSNVRSDRLSVTINTDRDFELSVTTYETDLTRSSIGRNVQPSISPFASGVTLLRPVETVPQLSAPETVRTAAASFERETATVSAGYVDIEHTLEPGEIAGGTFNFSIRQSYLDELGVDAEAVTLYHRLGREWVARETTLIGTDDTHFRFQGTMPEFSVFALGTGAPLVDVTEATLSASAVETGEAATVSATVKNRGQTAAEETIDLTVDGTVVGSETVRLASGVTSDIEFAYMPTATGEYILAVGGVDVGVLTASDTGRQPWWLVILLLTVVAVGGVLWRRRNQS